MCHVETYDPIVRDVLARFIMNREMLHLINDRLRRAMMRMARG